MSHLSQLMDIAMGKHKNNPRKSAEEADESEGVALEGKTQSQGKDIDEDLERIINVGKGRHRVYTSGPIATGVELQELGLSGLDHTDDEDDHENNKSTGSSKSPVSNDWEPPGPSKPNTIKRTHIASNQAKNTELESDSDETVDDEIPSEEHSKSMDLALDTNIKVRKHEKVVAPRKPLEFVEDTQLDQVFEESNHKRKSSSGSSASPVNIHTIPETQLVRPKSHSSYVSPDQEPADKSDNEIEKPIKLTELTIDDVGEVMKNQFGEEIAAKFACEHINGEALNTLMPKEADSPIFGRLGLVYGDVVMLKCFIRKKFQTRKNQTKEQLKPKLTELNVMSPARKAEYLRKRRKIGVLADEKWKGEIPSFRSPEEKKELEEFVDEIEEECICPAVQFTRDGIKEHIKHYFYQKNRDLAKGKDMKRKSGSNEPGCSKKLYLEGHNKIKLSLVTNEDSEVPDRSSVPERPPKELNLVSSGKILRWMFGPEPITTPLLTESLLQLYGTETKHLQVTTRILIQALAIKAVKARHVLIKKGSNLAKLSKKNTFVIKKITICHEE